MRRRTFAVWLMACVVAVGLVVRVAASINLVHLTALAGPVSAVGIEWLPAGNKVLISVNYPDGTGHNFEAVDRVTGALTQWGNVSNWSDEIYFETVRPGQPGGWPAGAIYSGKGAGAGNAECIAELDSSGYVTDPCFATLPGEAKLKRGGLVFDHDGVPGLNGALVVVASDDELGTTPTTIWKVAYNAGTHKGDVTKIGDLSSPYDTHSEGPVIIPNDTAKYGAPAVGGWAGQILLVQEYQQRLVGVDPSTGNVTSSTDILALSGTTAGRTEDLWVVPAGHDFYGADHDGQTIWKGDASQWTPFVGDVLLATEYATNGIGTPAQLWVARWNGAAFGFTLVNDGEGKVVQYEHITFAPTTGALKLSKALTGGPGTYTGPFTIHWDCGTFGSGDKSVSAGSFDSVTGIPSGTSCTVSEPTLPTAPAGYSFGTPTFTDSSGTPNDGIVTIGTPGAAVEVTTNNTLTLDTGNLKLSKALTGGPAGYTGPFTIDYDCNDGTAHDGSVTIAAGSFSTIGGIPVGTSCTVSETVPAAPAGYTFGTPTFSPSATVTVSPKGATVEVTTRNTLRQNTGVTRTQGFWATHSPLANIAWFGGTAFGHTFPGVAAVGSIGDSTLCSPVTKDVATLGKLMGGFWSAIAKKTSNVQRSALDKSRMQLLQQLLAAEMNASAFGTLPVNGSFQSWEAAYCGVNKTAIDNAQLQAEAFNTSGDSGVFTPGTPADPNNAKAIADRVFWDVLP